MLHVSYIIFLIISIVIWTIYRILVFKNKKACNFTRELFVNIFFLYFLVVIYFTFFKNGFLIIDFRKDSYVNFIPLVETIKMFKDNFMGIGNAFYNVIGNILLFVPLGFGVPLFFNDHNKLKYITFYGFISSCLIELLQYLTCVNLTDIDDVIFNTFGAILGFILFNLFILIIENTKFIKFINKLGINYKGNLIFVAFKPLGTITLVTILLCFGLLYNSTVSGILSNEEISQEVFNSSSGEYIESAHFFEHKLFLIDHKEYLELQIADEVLNNRWTNGYSSQLHWNGEEYGYSVEIINDDGKTGIVVYGKNEDAKTITINFNGKKYTEHIEANDFFITTYPTYQVLDEDTSIYNLYSTGFTPELVITFNEDTGSLCGDMNFIKP